MRRISRRSSLLLIAAAGAFTAVGAGTTAYYVVSGQDEGEQGPLALLPKTTARVTKQTLTQSVNVGGELGYGQTLGLLSKAQGTVTWLPATGAVISRGETLFRADELPVVLLYGPLPMYRPLLTGTTGPDVVQLKENLRALNYSTNLDPRFTVATESVVKRWQKALKVPDTGIVDMGRVVYADGPVRVASLTARVGSSASGEMFAGSGTIKVVTIDVPADEAAWAVKGTAVTVALPAGKTVPGEISVIGSAATNSQEGGATIPVTVSIADQAALAGLEKAPATVSYIAQRRENVLAVPIAALLALAEGGYGLEIVEGDTTRITAVETGLAAKGLIEVRGDGLAEGMTVGIAG